MPLLLVGLPGGLAAGFPLLAASDSGFLIHALAVQAAVKQGFQPGFQVPAMVLQNSNAVSQFILVAIHLGDLPVDRTCIRLLMKFLFQPLLKNEMLVNNGMRK